MNPLRLVEQRPISWSDLTLKKSQTYEAIVWDVAEKIVETLPEGPELIE